MMLKKMKKNRKMKKNKTSNKYNYVHLKMSKIPFNNTKSTKNSGDIHVHSSEREYPINNYYRGHYRHRPPTTDMSRIAPVSSHRRGSGQRGRGSTKSHPHAENNRGGHTRIANSGQRSRKPYSPCEVNTGPDSKYRPITIRNGIPMAMTHAQPSPQMYAHTLAQHMKSIGFTFPYKRLYTLKEGVIKSFQKLISFEENFKKNKYVGYEENLTEEKDFFITDISNTVTSSSIKFLDILGTYKNYDDITSENTYGGDHDCDEHYMWHETKDTDYFTMDWIVDYFIEDSRIKAFRPYKGRKVSPYNEWNKYNDYVENALVYCQNIYSDFKPPDHLQSHDPNESTTQKMLREELLSFHPRALQLLREGLYIQKDVQECSNESPSFLKLLFSFLLKDIACDGNVKNGRIFDACAGWGDRLVASMALQVEEYLGIDPNTNSIHGFREMVETFGEHLNGMPDTPPHHIPESSKYHEKYRILPLAMPLRVDIMKNIEGMYDIGFLSPPSFDSERYSDDNNQSTNTFSLRGQWIEKFLIPTIKQTFAAIKEGGFLVVQSILFHLIEPIITELIVKDAYDTFLEELDEYDGAKGDSAKGDSAKGDGAKGECNQMKKYPKILVPLLLGPISITHPSSRSQGNKRYKPMWVWKKVSHHYHSNHPYPYTIRNAKFFNNRKLPQLEGTNGIVAQSLKIRDTIDNSHLCENSETPHIPTLDEGNVINVNRVNRLEYNFRFSSPPPLQSLPSSSVVCDTASRYSASTIGISQKMRLFEDITDRATSGLYEKYGLILNFKKGHDIDRETLQKIIALRGNVWTPNEDSLLNSFSQMVGLYGPVVSLRKPYTDDKPPEQQDHDCLHIFITTKEGDVIASTRVVFHEKVYYENPQNQKLYGVGSMLWLAKNKEVIQKLNGVTATIERLVVDDVFQRGKMPLHTHSTSYTSPNIPNMSVINNKVNFCDVFDTHHKITFSTLGIHTLSGGLGKLLDVLCIFYSYCLDCNWVFCDVPDYRIKTLEDMGFSSELFLTKSGWHPSGDARSIEWTGMLKKI